MLLKAIHLFTFSLSFMYFVPAKAQINFILSDTVCSNDSLNLTANVNAYPATTFSWMAQPAGALFSSPTNSVTGLTFNTSGIYNITLMASVGNSTAYATHTVLVKPSPTILIAASTTTLCSGQNATLIATGANTYSWFPSPGFVSAYSGTAYISPSATDIYSVDGTNGYGCTSSGTIQIVYSSFPYLTTISTATAVCSGYQATLTAFGANSYTWMSAQFLNPIVQQTLSAAPGTFTLLGSNGGTCRDSIVLSIGQLPDLDLVVNSNRTIICKDGGDTLVPIVLTAGGASNYEWQPYQPGRMTYSIGAVTAVSPSVSTCYTVTGIALNCKAQKTICIQVTTCEGISDVYASNYFNCYPNPAMDFIQIMFEDEFTGTIEIMDVNGKMLIREFYTSPEKNVRLDISSFDTGIYFLRTTNRKNEVHFSKIVKQ